MNTGRLAKALLLLVMPLMARTVMNPERTVGPEQSYEIDWTAPVVSPLVR